jgi:hypothetical protein
MVVTEGAVAGAVGGNGNQQMPSLARLNAIAVDSVSARLSLDHSLTVGREAMPGQVVLDHPNVSSRHAAFEVAGGCIVLRDLGGINGTYVNGARLRGARPLAHGDRIDIGPFEFMFDGTALTSACRVGNVELLAQGISFDVPGRRIRSSPKRILHSVSMPVRVCWYNWRERLGQVYPDKHFGRSGLTERRLGTAQ